MIGSRWGSRFLGSPILFLFVSGRQGLVTQFSSTVCCSLHNPAEVRNQIVWRVAMPLTGLRMGVRWRRYSGVYHLVSGKEDGRRTENGRCHRPTDCAEA